MSYGDYAYLALAKIAACLATAVSEAVADGRLASNLCRVGVVPGEAVSYEFVGNSRCLDNETDGQGFVMSTGSYPTKRFPQPVEEAGAGPCAAADLAMNVNVGIIRTYPVPENGEPPSQDVLDAITANQYVEMGIVHDVLTCCFPSSSDAAIILGTYRPVGPVGAAIGGYWSATLELSDET